MNFTDGYRFLETHDSRQNVNASSNVVVDSDLLIETGEGNYGVLLELKRKWNNVLMEYGEEPIGIKTVASIVLG